MGIKICAVSVIVMSIMLYKCRKVSVQTLFHFIFNKVHNFRYKSDILIIAPKQKVNQFKYIFFEYIRFKF